VLSDSEVYDSHDPECPLEHHEIPMGRSLVRGYELAYLLSLEGISLQKPNGGWEAIYMASNLSREDVWLQVFTVHIDTTRDIFAKGCGMVEILREEP